ncbi:MAG: hypothetical protein IAE91_08960 [Ignavibacteriaceae bacterium]|nr:hypothetical protein [Ignavibacteriaceae bacterium]
MKIKLTVVIIFLLTTFASAQSEFGFLNGFPKEETGRFQGGLGLSWIDGKPHFTFRLTPDIAFGKWGIGLDLNLEFDSDGKLRDENFKTASDYLSIIRYVRYGQKKDNVFARIGALDYYTLGQGNIIYNYSNSPSFDNRKTGFAFDLDFDKAGFETMYSDFTSGGVLGIRGYVRPFKFDAGMSKIPILNTIELGLSFAGDFNSNAAVFSGRKDANGNFEAVKKDESLSMLGVDLGIPIVRQDILNLDLYLNYTKINNFGSGINSGFIMGLNGLGLLNVSVKFERRWNEGKYLPGYFGPLYEIERFSYDSSTGIPMTKAQQLDGITTSDNGWFGGLNAVVLNTFTITGSYERLDKTPNSGRLLLASDISPKGSQYVIRAGYEKYGIQSESEVFTTDDRSHLYVEAGYKPMEYLLVSLVYHWTFTPLRDANDNVIGYEPQKRIEPRVTFVYPFNVGK